MDEIFALWDSHPSACEGRSFDVALPTNGTHVSVIFNSSARRLFTALLYNASGALVHYYAEREEAVMKALACRAVIKFADPRVRLAPRTTQEKALAGLA
jgi:hypothetical protein